MSNVVNKSVEQAADTSVNGQAAANGQEKGPEAFHVRAVLSLVRQGDKVLAIGRHQHWELPGALTRPGESLEDCQKRGLDECTGLGTAERFRLYEGPNTIVDVVGAIDPAVAVKRALRRAWLTEAQLIANSERPALMRVVFGALKRAEIASSNVISKLADGRILYAIEYMTWGGKDWEAHEAHYVHAMNAQDAREQFIGLIPVGTRTKIIGVAPAIGFYAKDDDGKVLVG